jgi:hypothetical protein
MLASFPMARWIPAAGKACARTSRPLRAEGGGGGESTNNGDLSPSGGFGGGKIGYNWQGVFGLTSSWVLGIEADIQGSGISGSAVFGNTSVESSLNWFGTVATATIRKVMSPLDRLSLIEKNKKPEA